jgi:hypothetical protein
MPSCFEDKTDHAIIVLKVSSQVFHRFSIFGFEDCDEGIADFCPACEVLDVLVMSIM